MPMIPNTSLNIDYDWFPVLITGSNGTGNSARYSWVRRWVEGNGNVGNMPGVASGNATGNLAGVSVPGVSFTAGSYAMCRPAPGAGGYLYELMPVGGATTITSVGNNTTSSIVANESWVTLTNGASNATFALPSAGTYLLIAHLSHEFALTSSPTGTSSLQARFFDTTSSSVVAGSTTELSHLANGTRDRRTTTVVVSYAPDSARNVVIQGTRATGGAVGTYSVSSILVNFIPSDRGLEYVKLS